MGYSMSDEGFERLQRLLLAMRAGDDLKPADAARVSGLSERVCQSVLERLARAGLMAPASDGRYVRRTHDPVS